MKQCRVAICNCDQEIICKIKRVNKKFCQIYLTNEKFRVYGLTLGIYHSDTIIYRKIVIRSSMRPENRLSSQSTLFLFGQDKKADEQLISTEYLHEIFKNKKIILKNE